MKPPIPADQSHHTVQRSYLRQFANPQGWLWEYDFATELIKQQASRRATAHAGYYALKLSTGETSNKWEEVSGLIESKAAPYFKSFEGSTEAVLADAPREYLSAWIANQALRTTKIREMLEQALREPHPPFPHLSDGRIWTASLVHAQNIANMIAPLAQQIFNREWTIARFTSPTLMTSDNPVSNWNFGAPEIDPPALFAVPLSPLSGIIVGRIGTEDRMLEIDDRRAVSAINNRVVLAAHKYVYQNRDHPQEAFLATVRDVRHRGASYISPTVPS